MSNFTATARTNYVLVKDFSAACFDINQNGNTVHKHPIYPEGIMISGDSDGGCFNMMTENDDGDPVPFSWKDWATKHLQEGQVLVVMTVGAEALKYMHCSAEAYTWDGTVIEIDPLQELMQKLEEYGYDEETAAPAYISISTRGG